MIRYLKFGNVPNMHHTAHYSGETLLHEYSFTREGFEDPYSILYLHHPPTNESGVEEYSEAKWAFPRIRDDSLLERRHFRSGLFTPRSDFISGREILAFNDNINYGLCRPETHEDAFFANNDADELFFLFEGQIEFQSLFGKIKLIAGDYLIIPKSCPYRLHFTDSPLLLFVEARQGLQIPSEYLNENGQFKMDAPYSERSFKIPEWDSSLFETDGTSQIIRKRQGKFTKTIYAQNYFKMSGWDGYVYPYAINLENIQPKTARVHLPPSSHLTFSGGGFSVMSFLPRILDFDEKAIPCPFYHSSVDCDELLFYVSGDFTSRKTIESGSISYHPSGIPHGPHPGAYKNSIGLKQTQEHAVMVDTYDPLNLTQASQALEDPKYPTSWKENT